MESSPGPCKLDHGGLEPNAVAIYEEVMYRMLPLIHSSHIATPPKKKTYHLMVDFHGKCKGKYTIL